MQDHPPDEEIYHGSLINVRVQMVPRALGAPERFEIVDHPDAVAIVAVRDQGDGAGVGAEVVLVRQPRPAIGRETWELPAGLVDPTEREHPDRTAMRELREETGYQAEVWRQLAREYTSPGFTNEAITIYLATGVSAAPGALGGVAADPQEISRVRWVRLGEALAMCASGEIADGKTLLGLTLARDVLAVDDAIAAIEGDTPMPRDVTTMPFARSAPFREDEAPQPSAPAERTFDGSLKLENMLLEEYNYAGVTAYQAMEDRARVFNLYLLLIGVLVSGLGAIFQFGGSIRDLTQWLSVALLIVAGLLGFVFFLQLIRLRQAHRESLVAMNFVKEYYIEQFTGQMPGVEQAFRWRLRTIPTGERLGSVTFLVCYTVACLGSISFAAAAFVLVSSSAISPALDTLLSFSATLRAFLIAFLVLVISIVLHVVFYVRILSKRRERATLQKQVAQFGQTLPPAQA